MYILHNMDISSKVLTTNSNTSQTPTVKNSFKLSGGYTETTKSTEQNNFWSATINAKASNGDVQIFKADSLYGNKEQDIDGSDITGSMSNIEFAIYKENTTTPLSFKYENGKYVYDTAGTDKTVKTDSKGSVIVSGLTPGNYYFSEVSSPDGYYKEQNQKIPFDIANTKVTYKLANNNARGVSFTKVDSEDDTIKLKDAEFKLYKYTENNFSDKVEVTGFTKTTIDGKEYFVYDKNGTDKLITDENGKLEITHLDEGKYFLEEVNAPSGYVLSDKQYTFELNEIQAGDPVLTLENITNVKEEDPKGQGEEPDEPGTKDPPKKPVKKPDDKKKPVKKPTKNTKTSDNTTNPVVWITLVVISLGAGVTLIKKYRNGNVEQQ